MENSRQLSESQYANATKFNARIYLNAKFRTNQYPWPAWVFDQFEKPAQGQVLELGCGTGLLWQLNAKRAPAAWKITLSDFAAGMLEDARRNLANTGRNFEFKVINAEAIDMPDASYDIVIANHMLYHVPNRAKALAEIRRVLKEDGAFYATTVGAHNMLELKLLMKEFKESQGLPASFGIKEYGFSLENGEAQLRNHFDAVELRRYEDSLEITAAEPIVNYFLSFDGMYDDKIVLPQDKVEDFRRFLAARLERDGKIVVSKDSGIFICKPKGSALYPSW